MTNRKPICFIAMAFGHSDTDVLYEKQILPLLERKGIKPIRIDRRQSNDDINYQIFEQLKISDLCISDLTYTRPSVYFEAGYAQHFLPVIYTVRSDHLKQGQPEDRRVHFDLQMKPLIKWENPDDDLFSKQLERRIDATFLKAWEKKKHSEEVSTLAVSQFENKSLTSRLVTLRKLMIYGLRQKGFSQSIPNFARFTEYGTGTWNYGRIDPESANNMFMIKKCQNRKVKFISVQSYNTITKTELKKIYRGYSPNFLDNILFNKKFALVDTVYLHHFVLSLKPVSADRIEAVLSGLTPISKGICYQVIHQKIPLDKGEKKECISFWHFLTGINSEPQLKEIIDEHLSNYFLFAI
jgi:hypothetical protein